MRIDKLLAHSGYGTRKEVKQLLKKKRVTLNGEVIVNPKQKVDVMQDEVLVDDEFVMYEETFYLLMHKPMDVISATEDANDETVLDIMEPLYFERGVFPVGRLDKDTTGLLLLTNDGKLAHKLLSPKSKVDKEYVAKLRDPLTKEMIEALEAGITLEDGFTCMPAEVWTSNESGTEIHIVIQEGKYHQVKRMFAAVDNKVLALERIRMGTLLADEMLKPGEYRYLTEDELEALQGIDEE